MDQTQANSSPARSGLPDVDSLWNYDDPASTERAMRDVLPAARSAGDDDYLAQLLTQIARAQILQRRFDEGHATLDAAARILSERTPVARIRCLLERGRAWNDVHQAAQAAACFEEAFQRASAANMDTLAVDAAHMLGVMPPFDRAIPWNQRALAIAQASAEPRARRWVGSLFMNLGVNHQRLAQYDQAERAFASSVQFFEQAANAQRVRLGRLCLAKNRRLQGDPATALPLNRQLLEQILAAGEPPGYALEEIAECLLALGRRDEATPFFARVHAALSTYPWYPPNEPERLERLRQLGQQQT